MIAYAKANPGRLAYSSSGNGSAPHLAGEIFKKRADVQMAHVPYKGTSPALADTIAGNVQLTFANLVPTLPQVYIERELKKWAQAVRDSGAKPD